MATSRDPAMKKRLSISLLFALAQAWGEPGVPETEPGGVMIERENGGLLQLVMETNHIIFHFFDDHMNPLPADVDRITVRIHSREESQRFTVAIPYEGVDGLRAPLVIRPPHLFRGYLALMRNGGDEPVETYVVEYPGENG